jgi:hypothetical protein
MDDFLQYIENEKQKLNDALVQLEAAEKVYLLSGVSEKVSQDSLPSFSFNQNSQLTIKEAVLKILDNEYPKGFTAMQILKRLHHHNFPYIERTSLSPQLSRLKGEGHLVNVNGVWLLSYEEDKRRKNLRLKGGPFSFKKNEQR